MAGVLVAAQRTVDYVRKVRAELDKVTWPSWSDLRRMTVVITIFVIVIGIIIGIMDRVSSLILIEWLGRLFR